MALVKVPLMGYLFSEYWLGKGSQVGRGEFAMNSAATLRRGIPHENDISQL
jgi:hypothetical protein